MKTRTNEEWLMALKSDGEAQSASLSDLRTYLLRAARYTLHQRRSTLQQPPGEIEQLAEDCAQDAVSTILAHLHQFRGDSLFTTWAYKFAVNAALVAARRERWGRVPLDRLLNGPDLVERIGPAGDTSSDPHRRVLQREILAAVREGIEAHLTKRQRDALTAIVFEEVPLDELARHWASNRNALYKLLHDARRKLKGHLRDRGFGAKEVRDVFGNDSKIRP
jgi:RNA polymerase sigma-70 factor, ECF subfamily